MDLILNDEGSINGLEPKAVVLGENVQGEEGIRWLREIIHGDCFICRHDNDGNFASIEESDVETIQYFVKAILSLHADVIIIKE